MLISFLQNVLAPLNTRAIGAAGASIGTTSLITLATLISNADFDLSLVLSIRYHRDPHPVAQVVAASIGLAIGIALAYAGRPAYIPPAPPADKDKAP